MASQIDLGAVVPIGKGDWNSSTTYERTNIVRHNSTAWICKVATSTGVEPTESSSDWYLLVKDTSSVTSVNGMIGDVNINSILENPSTDDNSLKIASTSWVKTKVDNATNELNTQISQVSSKASTALQTANTANSTANTANSTANTANSTANTANSTANNALSKAEQVQTDVNGKLDNTTVHLVKTWKSTDGTSWYRKYSDGWIEQGGVVNGRKTTSYIVTLPTKFSNTNYVVTFGQYGVQDAGSYAPGLVEDSKTKTTFSYTGLYTETAIGNGVSWYACGF